MAVTHYQELDVWKTAMDLAEACYRATKMFPKEEMFGLTSQIRRAAASIPANIAEGHSRATTKDFLNFLSICKGSLTELETHLLLAHRVGLLKDEMQVNLLQMTDKVSRMLSGLRKALQRKLE